MRTPPGEVGSGRPLKDRRATCAFRQNFKGVGGGPADLHQGQMWSSRGWTKKKKTHTGMGGGSGC